MKRWGTAGVALLLGLLLGLVVLVRGRTRQAEPREKSRDTSETRGPSRADGPDAPSGANLPGASSARSAPRGDPIHPPSSTVTLTVRSESGSPLPGATVLVSYLRPSGSRESIGGSGYARPKPTDAAGRTSVPLYRGPTQALSARLTIEGPGHVSRALDIRLPAPLELTVVLKRGSTLSGLVSGVQPGDLAADRFRIVLRAAVEDGRWSERLSVAGDGTFSLDRVPPVPVALSFSDDEELYRDVDLNVSHPFAPVVIETSRKDDVGELRLPPSLPSGLCAYLVDSSSGKVVARMPTGPSPSPRSLRAGTYDAYLGPADFRTPGNAPTAARQRVVVAPGSRQDLAVRLEPAAVVDLSAADPRTGAALPEIEVRVLDDGRLLETYRIKAGATIGGLLPGCVLRVSGEGYEPADHPIRSAIRESVTIRLTSK